MPTPLWTYLADDHDRLDRAFQRAVAAPGTVDEEAYREFRQGLLRHIGIEEKILIPLLQPHLDDHGRAMLERI
ncbi:MAG: hemerythrin domain-containing protein, partial [Bacteroidetes bacterium]|nr:hemerythrin domain-containing protein [Bacteroidota bacterium]